MSGLIRRLRSIPSWQVALGLALLALGFLIAAQLASERPRVRYTTQERSPLVETVLLLQRQQEDLRQEILSLREDLRTLQQQGEGSAARVRTLNVDLQTARIAAGLIPLTGTGLVLQLEDSTQPLRPGADESELVVSARDLRTVVEELWLAGAEAISVNGERVTTTTAIIDIGRSILVNAAYLAQPYQISGLGPPDLYDRLLAGQGFVDFVVARGQGSGLGISFAVVDEVDIPAYVGVVRLQHARLAPSPTPSPSPNTAEPRE